MCNRLNLVRDWGERAKSANYCVKHLADQNGISPRTLERWFMENKRLCPRGFLHKERMRRARQLLVKGCSVKETAAALGYHNQQHFSRNFKTFHGYAPSQHARVVMSHFGDRAEDLSQMDTTWRVSAQQSAA